MPGETARLGRPVGFSLGVPESWLEIDLHPDTRDDAIAGLVSERVHGQPELWEHRSAITRLVRQQARRAWEAGAVHCACFVEPTEDGPVTGSVTVSFVAGPLDASSDDPGRVSRLAERLSVEQSAGEGDTWTSVTVAELPDAGPAARSYGVEDLELPDGAGWVRSVVMQTFVPVPGDRRVAIVSAASSAVALADVLLDLFDAVTSTFRLVDLDVEAPGGGR